MSQIFVFTAGNPDAKLHLADSIQKPIDDPQAKVFDNFDEAYHAELKRIRDEAGGFYAWDAVWGVRPANVGADATRRLRPVRLPVRCPARGATCASVRPRVGISRSSHRR